MQQGPLRLLRDCTPPPDVRRSGPVVAIGGGAACRSAIDLHPVATHRSTVSVAMVLALAIGGLCRPLLPRAWFRGATDQHLRGNREERLGSSGRARAAAGVRPEFALGDGDGHRPGHVSSDSHVSNRGAAAARRSLLRPRHALGGEQRREQPDADRPGDRRGRRRVSRSMTRTTSTSRRTAGSRW